MGILTRKLEGIFGKKKEMDISKYEGVLRGLELEGFEFGEDTKNLITELGRGEFSQEEPISEQEREEIKTTIGRSVL